MGIEKGLHHVAHLLISLSALFGRGCSWCICSRTLSSGAAKFCGSKMIETLSVKSQNLIPLRSRDLWVYTLGPRPFCIAAAASTGVQPEPVGGNLEKSIKILIISELPTFHGKKWSQPSGISRSLFAVWWAQELVSKPQPTCKYFSAKPDSYSSWVSFASEVIDESSDCSKKWCMSML